MNELQKMQLKILEEFSRVAENRKLTWYAMFGTLLGASRHGGFIPDDDDIDVAMPRADYNRLQAEPELFAEPYFLQTPYNDPPAAPRYMRLRRSDSTYYTSKEFPEHLTRGGHLGIYIDIFPLDDVPGSVSAKSMHETAQRVHQQMLGSAALDENTGGELPDYKAEKCYSMGGIAGQYLMFAKRYEWVCSRYSNEPYYTIPTLVGERGSKVLEKRWFTTKTAMKFESIQIPVPSGWRELLVASYPDGLLEPEKVLGRKEPEKENVLVDTKRSYKEYVSRYTDMLVDIEDKQVLLFGAGDSLRIWLERYSEELDIICTFDNAKSKWGTDAYGLQVFSPSDLPELKDKNSRLIIASIYHKEISEQLDNMNIGDYYIFIDGWNYGKESG